VAGGPGTAPVAVAEGDGQGVGRVEAGGDAGVAEHRGDHVPDLLFGCRSAPDDGLLDLAGGVFGDREVVRDGGEDGHTAGLSEFERGLRVFPVEGGFDGDLVRAEARDDVADRIVDESQPLGHGPVRTVCNVPRGENTRRLSGSGPEFDDPVASRERTGVDAEDGQPGGGRRFRS